ncbi:MAG: 50S ribosomal protein L10 [Endomicrobiia bacterium]
MNKQLQLENLLNNIRNSNGFLFTEYQGLKVEELNELRKNLKTVKSKYCVIKNTLLSIALKNANINFPVEEIRGPLGLVFIGREIDPVASAKKVVEFSKEHEKLKIKSGYLFGKFATLQDILNISKLPGKDVLINQLIWILRGQIAGLINVLRANLYNLVCVLEQIKNIKR